MTSVAKTIRLFGTDTIRLAAVCIVVLAASFHFAQFGESGSTEAGLELGLVSGAANHIADHCITAGKSPGRCVTGSFNFAPVLPEIAVTEGARAVSTLQLRIKQNEGHSDHAEDVPTPPPLTVRA